MVASRLHGVPVVAVAEPVGIVQEFAAVYAAATLRDDPGTHANIAAEQAVISVALYDAAALQTLMSEGNPAHFYYEVNQIVLRAMRRQWLRKDGLTDCGIDAISTFEGLRRAGKLEAVGGLSYLNAIRECCPSAALFPRYWAIVLRCSRQRHALMLGEVLAREAMDPDRDPLQLLGCAAICIREIEDRGWCNINKVFSLSRELYATEG